mmetsp:Transcript_22864/g.46189  ORF Transcript_22864/g.46189 Transcript_22864/m.46189 type:complete len:362 (+) Transcript_22864:47-1132(+)
MVVLDCVASSGHPFLSHAIVVQKELSEKIAQSLLTENAGLLMRTSKEVRASLLSNGEFWDAVNLGEKWCVKKAVHRILENSILTSAFGGDWQFPDNIRSTNNVNQPVDESLPPDPPAQFPPNPSQSLQLTQIGFLRICAAYRGWVNSTRPFFKNLQATPVLLSSGPDDSQVTFHSSFPDGPYSGSLNINAPPGEFCLRLAVRAYKWQPFQKFSDVHRCRRNCDCCETSNFCVIHQGEGSEERESQRERGLEQWSREGADEGGPCSLDALRAGSFCGNGNGSDEHGKNTASCELCRGGVTHDVLPVLDNNGGLSTRRVTLNVRGGTALSTKAAECDESNGVLLLDVDESLRCSGRIVFTREV